MRLSLTRKILILDEATSHIDTETEEIIQNGINVVKEGRTTFMIAQGKQFIAPALLGNVAAIIGSVISVRLMLWQTKKFYGE